MTVRILNDPTEKFFNSLLFCVEKIPPAKEKGNDQEWWKHSFVWEREWEFRIDFHLFPFVCRPQRSLHLAKIPNTSTYTMSILPLIISTSFLVLFSSLHFSLFLCIPFFIQHPSLYFFLCNVTLSQIMLSFNLEQCLHLCFCYAMVANVFLLLYLMQSE